MNDSDKTKEQLIRELDGLRRQVEQLQHAGAEQVHDRQQLERFQKIAELATYGCAMVDINGNLIYINDSFARMHGYTPAELIGKNLSIFHTQAQMESVARINKHLAETGEGMQSKEVWHVHRDGTEFPTLMSSWAFKGPDGKSAILCATAVDITEQKKAEQALRESEARYKAIFNSATEGILVGIIETRQIMYANPAICEMFGYAAEELTHLTINDIHPKEQLRYVSDRFEALVRTEAAFTQNLPCLRKNGTVFYADISATSIIIDNKACFVGFFTDTTEHKHTEDALRESEARYKAIFESAREGILVVNIETKQFKYANPAVCKIFGYTTEEFTHLTIKDIHPKKDLPQMLAVFAMHARGEKTLSRNIPYLRKDGTLFYVDISTTNVEIDKTSCIVGLLTDITDRKQAEESLRESEEKFRGLADRSFDMIFMTDTRGFITYLSPASERIFGYKPEEMVGKHFANFLIESEIPKATKRFTENLQGKKLDVLYLEAKKKNGSRIFIELNSSLVIQDGKTSGTQGVIKDVTERKKAEEQLQKAREELEIRVKQRTADLAGVVEDLQNEIVERKRAEESLRNTEERFRTIFENTIVGLYRTTPDGRILIANPALVKMMGCRSFEELAKVNLEKNGLDPSTPRSIFKKLIEKEGRVIGLESVWLRPDGTKLFVSESAFAVKDGKGKIVYYEGTAHDITKRKEAEAKLMLYQQQLRSLASELSLAEERLRRRIAAELHDHIAQNLAISKIKLESLAGDAEPDLVKSLNEVNGLISQTIEATRSLTFEISPPVLYELGFEAAVNWLAKQTRKRFGLEVEFADDGKPKPLNTDIRVLLFQAVRELLVNVVKHARAKKAKVSTCRIQKNIQITVEDNGVGFDAEAISAVKDPAKGGFGLFNIRERLDQIGGSVIINARAGKGTRITLTAPIEKQEKPRTRFAGARPDKNRKRRKKKERSA